jgi:hypothetical protein
MNWNLKYFKIINTTWLVGFLEQGLIVTDTKRLAKAYMHSREFKINICSLLPTDLLYFVPGTWLGLPSKFFLYKPLGKKGKRVTNLHQISRTPEPASSDSTSPGVCGSDRNSEFLPERISSFLRHMLYRDNHSLECMRLFCHQPVGRTRHGRVGVWGVEWTVGYKW